MISEVIMMIILILIGAGVLYVIFNLGSTLLKIAVHFITGWILLTVVNILPGINVPINLLTLIISGFGGVVGTILLALFYLIF